MFRNRIEAGRCLARELRSYRGRQDGVVLAIPRGGLPIGAVLARELGLPLDVMLVKKIGHPQEPEVAIGAVSLAGTSINDELAARLGVPRGYLAAESARLRESLRRRHEFFHGRERPVKVVGRTVILTDDGAATGQTLIAAIEVLRREGAAKVVVAVPVAAPDAERTLGRLSDELVCLIVPRDFAAIGQFYEDFTQVSDEEAAEILRGAKVTP